MRFHLANLFHGMADWLDAAAQWIGPHRSRPRF